MPKPEWTQEKKEVFLTNKPTTPMTSEEECYTVYQSWDTGHIWWCGWKNYSRLWSALRFGMVRGYNKTHQAYVKNTKTNEIVWRSWEDENPYRGR